MQRDIAEACRNRWPGILVAMGVSPDILNGKHHPCPVCGGKDRFRFDDQERGSFFCSHCEPRAGDGFELLMRITGKSFRQVADEVRQQIGAIPMQSPRPKTDATESLKSILGQCQAMTEGDAAWRYLSSRGIRKMPLVGVHPGLRYLDEGQSLGVFPAMIASARNSQGRIVALHRTYLQDGAKAAVPSPKKTLGPIAGTALRLFPAQAEMGVGEGIESACGAAQRFDLPVWSALNATELARFTPPHGVDLLHIFADHDANFVGQMAAFKLAASLHDKVRCVVHVPDGADTDWADGL